MKDLINEDGSVNVHEEFTFDIYKSNIWNLIEEVKNLDTNKIVEVSREKLRQLKPIIL